MLKLIAALSLIAMSAVPQQSQSCASPDRRTTAIRLARRINTAEAAGYSQSQRYVGLASLQVPPAPDGLQVQLSTDGTTYTFSIKDTLDACHAAAFSDQNGVIYTGAPIQ
jgi:hypothetical protein